VPQLRKLEGGKLYPLKGPNIEPGVRKTIKGDTYNSGESQDWTRIG